MIDIEMRRALCFAYLMRGDALNNALNGKSLEYIKEKWLMLQKHPCPEQLLYVDLRVEVFHHIEAWVDEKEFEKYKEEQIKWGNYPGSL